MAEAAEEATGGSKPSPEDVLRSRREEVMKRIDAESSGLYRLDDGQWHDFTDPATREHYLSLDYRTGLALSGGGIRSATIALGLSEALASRDRLYAFDMLSTVSGGGYFGSFLRSLHVTRGSPDDERKVVVDRSALAQATMISLPDQQYFRGDSGHSPFVAPGKTIKNPLWWLRENGRYLAPAGTADYRYALAYILRGWVSLLTFVFGIAWVGFAVLQILLPILVRFAFDREGATLRDLVANHLYSPLFPVLVVFGWIGLGIAGSYWLTIPLPFANTAGEKPKGAGWADMAKATGFVAAVLLGLLALHANHRLPGGETAIRWVEGFEVALTAALATVVYVLRRTRGGTNLDIRREQTRLFASFLTVAAALASVTAIDWAALSWLDRDGGSPFADFFTTGALSGTLASVVSYLIAKLPDWLGGQASGFGKFLVDHARHFALLAAVTILLSIAFLADVLVLDLTWHGPAWSAEASTRWGTLATVTGLVGLVTLLFARSLTFVNLLGLTPFYGSRLTRTFVGGSNVYRLDTSFRSEVTRGLDEDDVPLETYMRAKCAAPLHFVNVTRNRTIGEPIRRDRIDVSHDDPLVRESVDDPRGRLATYESSLTMQDRHGDRMVFGPHGLRVGAEFYGWNDLEHPPSLGLLCAISGAAVGPGMGRLTSLGTSMAFTLANVRLGYWWPEQVRAGEAKPEPSPLSRRLPGLTCLTRELLGRFGTRDHWFLSDGGHSENTGVLTLLERDCRFILASDNGQDEDYTFCDLEILIRTARTDIGMEVAVVDRAAFPKSLAPVADCFFNGIPGDWRKNARKKNTPGFALLLKASDIPRRVNGVWKRHRKGDAWIVWLKPNRFAHLSADLATYADLHPDFPQQTTGNQFFDEAQWESYRRLGFEMGRRLFARREPFDPFLPRIRLRTDPLAATPAPVAGGPTPPAEGSVQGGAPR